MLQDSLRTTLSALLNPCCGGHKSTNVAILPTQQGGTSSALRKVVQLSRGGREIVSRERRLILSADMNPMQRAAEAALAYVHSDTVIGLGTGSTADCFLVALAAALRDGRLKNVRGIA